MNKGIKTTGDIAKGLGNVLVGLTAIAAREVINIPTRITAFSYYGLNKMMLFSFSNEPDSFNYKFHKKEDKKLKEIIKYGICSEYAWENRGILF